MDSEDLFADTPELAVNGSQPPSAASTTNGHANPNGHGKTNGQHQHPQNGGLQANGGGASSSQVDDDETQMPDGIVSEVGAEEEIIDDGALFGAEFEVGDDADDAAIAAAQQATEMSGVEFEENGVTEPAATANGHANNANDADADAEQPPPIDYAEDDEYEDEPDEDATTEATNAAATTSTTTSTSTSKPAAALAVNREPHATQLPLSRIKALMKTNPDCGLAGSEATFLMCKATELFIESLSRESFAYTAEAKKKTVQLRDVQRAIESVDALMFLEGALT